MDRVAAVAAILEHHFDYYASPAVRRIVAAEIVAALDKAEVVKPAPRVLKESRPNMAPEKAGESINEYHARRAREYGDDKPFGHDVPVFRD